MWRKDRIKRAKSSISSHRLLCQRRILAMFSGSFALISEGLYQGEKSTVWAVLIRLRPYRYDMGLGTFWQEDSWPGPIREGTFPFGVQALACFCDSMPKHNRCKLKLELQTASSIGPG